jgi:hypothetical protein
MFRGFTQCFALKLVKTSLLPIPLFKFMCVRLYEWRFCMGLTFKIEFAYWILYRNYSSFAVLGKILR